MRIPFDIKYRPQIESGEYKVETKSGRPIRVLAWDLPCDFPIATAEFTEDNRVIVESYSVDGWVGYGEKENNLVIVTPEPELTPLEDLLSTYLKNDFEYFSTKKWDEKKWNEVMRIQAAELLPLARKQLQPEIDAEIEKAYKTADEVQYRKGWEEALKDLPRWKLSNCPRSNLQSLYLAGDGTVIYKDGYEISISDLEKLPKEDSHE